MCMEKIYPGIVAKKDIPVWKIFVKYGKDYELVTPYQTVYLSQVLSHKSVGPGYHAFSSRCEAAKYIRYAAAPCSKFWKIVSLVIPKGTKYWVGDEPEFPSMVCAQRLAAPRRKR